MKSLVIILLAFAAVVAIIAFGVSISYFVWNYCGLKEFNERIAQEGEEDEV